MKKKGRPVQRADFGAPIDGFIAKQPEHLRVVLDALRDLVKKAAPDAQASIKWGMPFFTVNGKMMSLGGHKAHVNLVLAGAFPDPEGLVSGSSEGGRHLKLTRLDDLPRAAVSRWLRVAAHIARGKR